MGTRRGYGNVGAAHVQTVQNIINQLGTGFVPRQDPLEELSREIEVCYSFD